MKDSLFQQYLVLTIASLRVSSELTRQLLLSNRLRHEKKRSLSDLDKKINNFLKVTDIEIRKHEESLVNIDLVHEAMAELLTEIIENEN